jgi:hypothetical protein
MDTRNAFGFFETFNVKLYAEIDGQGYCAVIKRGGDIVAVGTADNRRTALADAMLHVRSARWVAQTAARRERRLAREAKQSTNGTP